jgi:hypothetical protein
MTRGKESAPSGRVYSDYDRAYKRRPEVVEANSARKQARREAEREGRVHKGDGKDVHHVKPLASGGKNGPTRVISASANRAMKPAHLKKRKKGD